MMRKAERTAALIYAHFKKEFESGAPNADPWMFLSHRDNMHN